MTERWLDQYLGQPLGDATRAEVLNALRQHIPGELIAEHENPDGTTASHIAGWLVEASRDPDTWDTTELFSVVTHRVATVWHKNDAFLEHLAADNPQIREGIEALGQEPLLTFGIPETGITPYPGTDAGTSGYRFTQDDGSALAIVLWQGVMHVTDDGDLAPGFGGFTTTTEGDDE